MFKAPAGILHHLALALSLALFIGLPQAAAAQDEEKIAKTRELIEVMKMVERADRLMIFVMTEMERATTSANPGKEESVAGLVREKFVPAIRRRLPAYLEQVVGLYAEHFTLVELEETIAFYKSPTGRKWIDAQAVVSTRTQQLALGWAQGVMAEVMSEVEADFQERGLMMPPI